MAINDTWKLLYKNVMQDDYESQENYIRLIGEKVRQLSFEALIKEKALFIPNNEYIMHFTNIDSLNYQNGFYNNDVCIWNGQLIFPIFGVDGDVYGICGFDPAKYLQARETGDYSLHYYNYSVKNIFNKGNFLFWGDNGFENAFNLGYVILVDGVFDAIQLRRLGFSSAALMGSSLTESIIAQLRFFNKVIIISDNDSAGFKLECNLKKYLNNCIYLRQSFNKDVDGAIKDGYESSIIAALNEIISSPVLIDRVIR